MQAPRDYTKLRRGARLLGRKCPSSALLFVQDFLPDTVGRVLDFAEFALRFSQRSAAAIGFALAEEQRHFALVMAERSVGAYGRNFGYGHSSEKPL